MTIRFILACTLMSAALTSPALSQTDVNARDSGGVTALERAVGQGDLSRVLALIKAGADVNSKTTTGRTALSWAAFQGRLEIVQALARAGADLNVRDQQGWTPLSLASEAEHFDVVKALIDAGAEVDRDRLRRDVNAQVRSGPWTPLQRAASKADIGNLRALVQLGADVNAPDSSGRTVLFGAKLDVVRALIEAGADVNRRDSRGWTAVLLASMAGQAPTVQALIEARADPNVAGPNGWDALMGAAYLGHLDTVRVLLPAADVNRRTRDGITALMLARWACHRDIVEVLTRAGAVTNPDEWKRAPRPQDFPAGPVFKGPPAPVDLRSHPDAPNFRTRLKTGARKGPNFAGHYTVVAWGCGSNCESTMIVDAMTGKVYGGFGDERGAEFGPNSNLVIADPAIPSQANAYADNPTDRLPVRYYLWSDHRFKLIYEEACSVAGGHQKCGCEE